MLADYFDLIGGTSTGSIIAAALAIGMTVDQIRELYLAAGGDAFGTKLPFYAGYERPTTRHRWNGCCSKGWARSAWAIPPCAPGCALSPSVRTPTAPGRCTTIRAAATTRPTGRSRCGRRCGPARPHPQFFVPELMEIPDRQGRPQPVAFVDGGVSMAVNPALQLFLLATMQAYAFRWATGADKLLLVSAGTGVWERVDNAAEVASGHLWDWASRVPGMLMDDASWQAQLMLQWWSNSATPWQIDREIGDLRGDVQGQRELLSYLRYDVRIEPECLRLMGMTDLADLADGLHQLDNVTLRDAFDRIGRAAAERTIVDPSGREIQYGVMPAHFPPAFDLH